jgi:asparagine synthase (glutamine-hydrolysing)
VSAVAGCCWFDGRPASIDDLRPSTDAALHRSKEPFRFRCAGSATLAYAADRPDSCQPFHDPATHTTLIVDGRVDNLDELANALGTGERTVASVVLAAWRRWGVEAGAKLLGDFVLVLSDEQSGRIVVIRDPMGQRSLFYAAGAHGVVFGSEVQQIVRHPAIRAELNEAMIAEYLTGHPETVTETLWAGVERLAPAHFLEITAKGACPRRYWDFDPDARVRYARDEEYAEHFREIFLRAVECRVRDVDALGVMLSGGIDSSSIAGAAQSIGATRGREPVHAFTLAFPGRPCDETVYSRAVIEKWGLKATFLDAQPPAPDDLRRQCRRYFDVPAYPNSSVADRLRVAAASAGVRVLLTGCGGDDFFSGDSPTALLREGHFIAWGRAMVSPLLSERARATLRPVLGARPVQRPWIQPTFAARTSLEDRLRRRADLPSLTREQQNIRRGVASLVQVLGDEMEERAALAAGVDQRHPFYDRRVAEFGLALPSSQRSRGQAIKIVLRHALGDYLPPLVAARMSLADKAEFSSTYLDAFEAMGGRDAFTRLLSEEAGWVDGRVVRQMYEDMIRLYSRGGDAYISFTGPLWAVASLELWLDGVTSIRTACSGDERSLKQQRSSP